MTDYNKYIEANKTLWNKRTAIHKDSAFYDVAGFKAGKNVLTPIELSELGDVKGKKMLHLQCHFGLDTLSWARLGADITGIDFSDEAIRVATQLNNEVGLSAKFICCNIYDLLPRNFNSKASPLGEFDKADIVLTSYGVIGWLPDLDQWAEIISYYLKPGGTFYMAEFHPVIWMFDDDFKEIVYCYEKREVIETEIQGTYTDRNADIKAKEYGWNHSISEVLNALIAHGMHIDFFNEHMHSPYPCFNNLVQNKDGNWWIKGLEDKIPMVYSVKATKPH
jgi:2-polyprenyl-3-methyl-5-hydroxy-6-metoxy-1,4-benzoquinol methylase